MAGSLREMAFSRFLIFLLCGWCGLAPAHAALHSGVPNTPAKSGHFRGVCRDPYHNPETGRFWTQDSYEGNGSDPRTLHKYLYAHDDPINFVDPSGNFEFSINGLVSNMAIGGIINAGVGVAATGSFDRVGKNLLVGAISGGVGYGLIGGGLKALLALRSAAFSSAAASAAPQIANALLKVKSTGPLISGTQVPKYFTLAADGGEVFLNPNATKHIAELLKSSAAAETKLAFGITVESLDQAVTQAIGQGIKYEVPMQIGRWELIFVMEKQTGQGLVPLVLKHCLYR